MVRREKTGLYFQSNAAFIVGDSDVVVVDAQFSQGATREVVAAGRPTLKASSHAATEAALYASEITNLGDLLCLDAARVRRFYAALATYDLL